MASPLSFIRASADPMGITGGAKNMGERVQNMVDPARLFTRTQSAQPEPTQQANQKALAKGIT